MPFCHVTRYVVTGIEDVCGNLYHTATAPTAYVAQLVPWSSVKVKQSKSGPVDQKFLAAEELCGWRWAVSCLGTSIMGPLSAGHMLCFFPTPTLNPSVIPRTYKNEKTNDPIDGTFFQNSEVFHEISTVFLTYTPKARIEFQIEKSSLKSYLINCIHRSTTNLPNNSILQIPPGSKLFTID
jgi:hypothetical protein